MMNFRLENSTTVTLKQVFQIQIYYVLYSMQIKKFLFKRVIFASTILENEQYE